MVKFEEANRRLIVDVFVCRQCKRKVKAPSLKISQGKIHCRHCKSKKLRPKRRK